MAGEAVADNLVKLDRAYNISDSIEDNAKAIANKFEKAWYSFELWASSF